MTPNPLLRSLWTVSTGMPVAGCHFQSDEVQCPGHPWPLTSHVSRVLFKRANASALAGQQLSPLRVLVSRRPQRRALRGPRTQLMYSCLLIAAQRDSHLSCSHLSCNHLSYSRPCCCLLLCSAPHRSSPPFSFSRQRFAIQPIQVWPALHVIIRRARSRPSLRPKGIHRPLRRLRTSLWRSKSIPRI